MGGIKPLIAFQVAFFHFAIMPRGEGTGHFMVDAMPHETGLKNGWFNRVAI